MHGVRGIDYAAAGFFPLDDLKDWQSLPDGAVVVVDECYSAFPRRMPGAKVPAYVEALATHRHRTFDFLLICPQAKQQVDGFVLGLVEWHEAVVRVGAAADSGPAGLPAVARVGVLHPGEAQASQADQPQQVPQENASGTGASGGGSMGWLGGGGAQSYTPPGAPGSWNADAFGGSSNHR